jgi:hypothetical protein
VATAGAVKRHENEILDLVWFLRGIFFENSFRIQLTMVFFLKLFTQKSRPQGVLGHLW